MMYRCMRAFAGCDKTVEHPRVFMLPPEGWVWLSDWGRGVEDGMYCKQHADELEEALLAPGDLPPPPFRRTRYYVLDVVGRADRRDIDPADVLRALAAPYRRERQPDGRWRQWVWVAGKGHWLRVITEADGETVHNAFWDRVLKP